MASVKEFGVVLEMADASEVMRHARLAEQTILNSKEHLLAEFA